MFPFQINPKGTVPSYVDPDGETLTDSLQIANYLDKKHPEPALYKEETKSRDLELLDHYSKVLITFFPEFSKKKKIDYFVTSNRLSRRLWLSSESVYTMKIRDRSRRSWETLWTIWTNTSKSLISAKHLSSGVCDNLDLILTCILCACFHLLLILYEITVI